MASAESFLYSAVQAYVHEAADESLMEDIRQRRMTVINCLPGDLRERSAARLLINSLSANDIASLADLYHGRQHIVTIANPCMEDPNNETLETIALGVRTLLTSCAGGRPSWKIRESQQLPWENCNGCRGGCGYAILATEAADAMRLWNFATPGDILSRLTELSCYVLERPEYSLPSPPSVVPAQRAKNIAIVVRSDANDPIIRLMPDLECAPGSRAFHAKAELDSVLDNPKSWSSIGQKPGTILIARSSVMLIPQLPANSLSSISGALALMNERQSWQSCLVAA